MTKVCSVCGDEFEAKRSDAKACSSTCRNRASKGTPVSKGSEDDGLVRLLIAELEDAGRLETVAGKLAVHLAEQMTAAGATGIAALSKEFRVVKAEALAGIVRGPVVEDEVDKARRAREAKRSSASSS